MEFLSFVGVIALIVWMARLQSRVAGCEQLVEQVRGRLRAPALAGPVSRLAGAPAEAPTPPDPLPDADQPPAASPVPAATRVPAPPRPVAAADPIVEEPAAEPDPVPESARAVPGGGAAGLDPAPAGESDDVAAAKPGRRAATARPEFSLESFLGGRVLLIAGVIAVLFGVAFFLKVAIERGLFPPQLRILMGALAGVGALAGGDRLRRRYDVFGHALMGCGLGALYLCTFFSAVHYGFISDGFAFGLAGVLTALGVTLALVRRAPALAYLGFFGGFVAPGFLGIAADSLPGLAAWLLVLNLGAAAVLCRRRWAGIDVMALFATVLYFGTWAVRHGAASPIEGATVMAGLTAGQLVLALLPAILTGRRTLPTSLLTVLAVGVWAVPMGAHLLYPAHRVGLGVGVIGLAAAYLCGMLALPRTRDGKASPEVPILGACGLAALATAVPILLDGPAMPIAWAATGLATVFIGVRRKLTTFQVLGVASILLAIGSLPFVGYHTAPFVPLLSGISLAYLWPIAALGGAGWLILRQGDGARTAGGLVLGLAVWLFVPYLIGELWNHVRLGRVGYGPHWEHTAAALVTGCLAVYATVVSVLVRNLRRAALLAPAFPLFATLLSFLWLLGGNHPEAFTPLLNGTAFSGLLVVGAVVAFTWWSPKPMRQIGMLAAVGCLLALVSSEFYWWGERRELIDTTRKASRFAAQVGISVSWALSGAALLAAGFARRVAELRWAGITVFLVTAGKVFLVDMAALDTVYKVGSFLVLGVLLVGASFLYQRARRQLDAAE